MEKTALPVPSVVPVTLFSGQVPGLTRHHGVHTIGREVANQEASGE